MPLTVKDFVTRAPSFKCVAPAAIQRGLDEAERCTNRNNWGVKADDGVFYQAAHLISLNAFLGEQSPSGGVTAPSGPIESERLLEWSAKYATSDAFSGEALSTTSWGRQFIALRRTIFSNRCI